MLRERERKIEEGRGKGGGVRQKWRMIRLWQIVICSFLFFFFFFFAFLAFAGGLFGFGLPLPHITVSVWL